MRALICHTFARYTFEQIDDMILDDWSDLAAAALWLQDEENKRVQSMMGGGRKSRRK